MAANVERGRRAYRRVREIRGVSLTSTPPSSGAVLWRGEPITGQPPHLNARMGLTRTFQIVQPFAAQTVRENIAVGAHLHLPRRTQALEFAESVALQVTVVTPIGNAVVSGGEQVTGTGPSSASMAKMCA